MSIEDFLSPKEPLGPTRHESIMKFLGASGHREYRYNLLIYKFPIFDRILPAPNPIILGRRGSGKTAIITALLAQSTYKHYYYVRNDEPNESDDIVTYIQSWDQLDEIVNNVGRDCKYEIGQDTPWEELVSETAARHWERHIFLTIFNQVYKDANSDNSPFDMRQETPSIFEVIEKSDFADPFKPITNSSIFAKQSKAKEELISHLRKNGRSCYVIIDSLDTYPITSTRFSRLTGGFLRCITNISDSYYDIIKIHCCMPEEIEPRLFDLVDNELRDLSPSSSYTRIHWRPRDLFKIVAERYKEFLLIHFRPSIREDHEFLGFLNGLTLSESSDLKRFFREVLPGTIVNKFREKENALAYITRHTQLLPREFMLIFNEAIRRSYLETSSWRRITESALVAAISETESALARQVMKPYRPIYPSLLDACEKHLTNLKPVCGEDDLDAVANKFQKMVAHESEQVWKTLFEIGVIGYVEPNQQDSKRYVYGRFHFNSENHTFSKGSHLKYCVHPSFSGAFHTNRTDDMKFVYPASIPEEVLD